MISTPTGKIRGVIDVNVDDICARFPRRGDFEGGATLVHGTSRLNIAPADLTAFVDPADAALVCGFQSLAPGDTFDESFPVWMATMRRRAGNDAIMESLQHVFTRLSSDESLVHPVVDAARDALCSRLRTAMGYTGTLRGAAARVRDAKRVEIMGVP